METRAIKTSWFDLPVFDMNDARSFYEGLFKWQFLRLNDPSVPDYLAIQVGPELIGGLRKVSTQKRDEAAPILYFTVDDLDAYTQRVKELGGHLVGTRVELGNNGGSYQWFRDREGNVVGLWSALKEGKK